MQVGPFGMNLNHIRQRLLVDMCILILQDKRLWNTEISKKKKEEYLILFLQYEWDKGRKLILQCIAGTNFNNIYKD